MFLFIISYTKICMSSQSHDNLLYDVAYNIYDRNLFGRSLSVAAAILIHAIALAVLGKS